MKRNGSIRRQYIGVVISKSRQQSELRGFQKRDRHHHAGLETGGLYLVTRSLGPDGALDSVLPARGPK